VTVSSAIDLVLRTSQSACVHDVLARRFNDLQENMVRAGDSAPEADLRRWTVERLHIEADEPPILRVLDAVCYNEQARSMGYGEEAFAKIGFFQRLFANFFDFRGQRLIGPSGRNNPTDPIKGAVGPGVVP
jgi:hypothetical protein